jgi:hypothetical protein
MLQKKPYIDSVHEQAKNTTDINRVQLPGCSLQQTHSPTDKTRVEGTTCVPRALVTCVSILEAIARPFTSDHAVSALSLSLMNAQLDASDIYCAFACFPESPTSNSPPLLYLTHSFSSPSSSLHA